MIVIKSLYQDRVINHLNITMATLWQKSCSDNNGEMQM